MGRVKDTARAQKKLDNKYLEPQVINEHRIAQDRADGFETGPITTQEQAMKWKYPTTAHHVGHWLRGDPRDTDMTIRKELLERGRLKGQGNGTTEYGQLMVGPEVVDYVKDKKEQEQYLGELALAEALIDGKQPWTQEHAYSMYKELREEPENWHASQLALQEAVRSLLHDGVIRDKEDNRLIAKIVRDDFVFPMLPAWDPAGIILGKIDAFQRLMQLGYNRGN